MNPQGIYYIAIGDEYVREAKVSAKSAKEAMDDIHITAVTDQSVDSQYIDNIVIAEDPNYSFEDQVLQMDKPPYEKTLRLDTDIYVNDDISEVFDLLDNFDFAAAHNPARISWDVEEIPDCFPEYNGGVMAFKRNEKFEEFISNWKEEYYHQREKTGHAQNQPSLRKTLYESNLRIATLPHEYNCIIRHPGQVTGRVKLFHGRLLDIQSNGSGEFHDMDAAVERINSTDQQRVFTQLGGISVYSNKTNSLFHRTRMAIRRRGLLFVFKRMTEKIRAIVST